MSRKKIATKTSKRANPKRASSSNPFSRKIRAVKSHPLSRSHTGFYIAIAAVLVLGIGAVVNVFKLMQITEALAPGIITVEAEKMKSSSTSGVSVYNNASLSAGQAVRLTTDTRKNATTQTNIVKEIKVNARGDQCDGAPVIQAKVDGKLLGSKQVSSTGWTQYTFPTDLSASNHNLELSLANPYKKIFRFLWIDWTLCTRTLHIDKSTYNGPLAADIPGPSSTPSSPPLPSGPSSTGNATLTIPRSGTVLTLSGLNYNVYNDMPQKFQGIFSRAPYVMKKIDYPASLDSNSITKGVASLNTMLRSTQGQKIVLGHSQGAQVASHWMRKYANDPTAPPASELTFILSGNPLRSAGGYLIGRPEVGSTIGQPTPTNTKWPIIDVARRYDGWADWVQDQGNRWAVNNANAGKSTIHSSYHAVNLYASTNTVWKSGNTTYVLTKEDDLPVWSNDAKYPVAVRAAVKSYIESAYKRTANDPRTNKLPVESSWQDELRTWGIPF